MSKFMDFLNNIDEKIINETYTNDVYADIDEEVEVVKPKLKKTPIKKDGSVKLIEKRIRHKLDIIGLNDKAIADVVSYVLEDIQAVKGVKSKIEQKPSPVESTQVVETVMSRAESLLDGMSDVPTYGVPMSGQSVVNAPDNVMSEVADIASSLLG